MSFKSYSFPGIDILYLVNDSQILNPDRAVKWFVWMQKSVVEYYIYTVYEYIWSISKHEATNFISSVNFNILAEYLSKVEKSDNW